MGMLGYPGIAKPTSFLVRLDPSSSSSTNTTAALCFRFVQPFFSAKCEPRPKRDGWCRAVSSSAVPTSCGGSRAQQTKDFVPATTKSIYARSSLKEMREERTANRARVYEFLRGIGIVPDELDGLEMPVTVDVMRERVDFLHSLGLTIEDINDYPLVLGCSVKKNMIPVLDYLGKVGVRRSTLTEFLRRYPQVLHASVKVDLEPVVKYLQGMDIKPHDVARVIERYPEALGFKLEGTMSTSVAYLVAIGVARRQIGSVLTRYPEVLGMRVGRVIKPFVDYLETLGMPRLAVARLIESKPHVLGCDLRDQVKSNVGTLLEFGVRKEALPSVIIHYPDIVGMELKPKLLAQKALLESTLMLGTEEFGSVMEKMPQVVSLTRESMLRHVDFLKICGFSISQVKKMVVGCPQLLALNMDIMETSFRYFQDEMDRDLEDLVTFPAFFTYGLESTIKPRHHMVSTKGLKCSLGWLLNCTDAKFEERMSYDSISIEEMEPKSSFDTEGVPEDSEPSEEEYYSLFDSDEDSDDEYI